MIRGSGSLRLTMALKGVKIDFTLHHCPEDLASLIWGEGAVDELEFFVGIHFF